jgi:hypothetical protein
MKFQWNKTLIYYKDVLNAQNNIFWVLTMVKHKKNLDTINKEQIF